MASISADFFDELLTHGTRSNAPSKLAERHQQEKANGREGNVIQAIKHVLNFCRPMRARLQVANTGGLSRRHRLLRTGMAACTLGGLVGCGEAKNPDEYPVSHWAKDNDACVRASVATIGKAGLPFPNFTYEDEPAPSSGARPKRRVKTVDMWLGPTRFVVPAEVAVSNGAYAEHHPRRYQGLAGTLPHFYPKGPRAPEIDGMGSRVDVTFRCSMEAKYTTTWGKGYRSNQDSIDSVKALYEKESQILPTHPGEVSINRREDIGMIEVLLDRKTEANGMRSWQAVYWPIDDALKGVDGSTTSIACKTRHDPVERRYGKQGWRCSSGVRLTPEGGAQIDIYVSHIQQMPAVFKQVKQLLINAKQPSVE